MMISFDLPPGVEDELKGVFDDLSASARDAFIIRGYQERRFGLGMVRRLLGADSRWDAERWLHDHGVAHPYSERELADDRATLNRALGKGD